VVKAFGGEEDSLNTFNGFNDALYNSAWKAVFFSGLMMPITNFIGNLAFVATCILGGYYTVNGRMTIGGIQAFIQYMRQFNQPISQMAQISNVLQQTAAAAERVFEFLDEAEESADARGAKPSDPSGAKTAEPSGHKPSEPGGHKTANPSGHKSADLKEATAEQDQSAHPRSGEAGNIEFDHVRFGYREDKIIIRDFCARIRPGQKIAIVGPTGAGKTTIVKLLMRFYDLNGGAITIGGRDITLFRRDELHAFFGMVLQDTWLFNGTLADNIRYGRLEATVEEVQKAAEAAQADHFIRTLPEGYRMMLNEEADNISQGQKQLLTIARAILADPTILILDEATSSVDTRTEVLIQKAMDYLMQGRTSFIIAHRLSTIRNADLILVMRDGDIVEQGSHDELIGKNGFYAELYNSQFAAE
jgi:ATP-binding cassette subfamily B protein